MGKRQCQISMFTKILNSWALRRCADTLIRKHHKIYSTTRVFLRYKRRLFQKRKRNGRIGGRGEAAALHHVCTRCTNIKMHVVFHRRNLFNAARVFDHISLGKHSDSGYVSTMRWTSVGVEILAREIDHELRFLNRIFLFLYTRQFLIQLE